MNRLAVEAWFGKFPKKLEQKGGGIERLYARVVNVPLQEPFDLVQNKTVRLVDRTQNLLSAKLPC